MKRKFQRGQVAITGIIMLSLIVLLLLYAFDVHNVIRAKFKMETAQEAAAMAGAYWQKETLNLIGELNIIKAAAVLLEDSTQWQGEFANLPDKEIFPQKYKKAIQKRIDLLTEMQTRISFIGPLAGFAAAQQAAKANGLAGSGKISKYIESLKSDPRYDEIQGGAPRLINNYDWKEPYLSILGEISDGGIAVYPNARVMGSPETVPRQLANEAFYTEVQSMATSVAGNDPPLRYHFTLGASLYQSMDDPDFRKRWWDIKYDTSVFPRESEIYTVGVEFGADYTEETVSLLKNNLDSEFSPYDPAGSAPLPGEMKWCRYDDWWYPDYYRNNHTSYDSEHYSYWFSGEVLQDPVKPQYCYEGPAAYAEGSVTVDSVISVKPGDSVQSGLLKKRSTVSTVIGSKRGESIGSTELSEYRPGAIAKVLGELKGNTAPIELPIILPVFKRSAVMPTYMPIPYGFQVLSQKTSLLEEFLKWLDTQENLNGIPPLGTERFLKSLQLLANGVNQRASGSSEGSLSAVPSGAVAGRGLRYYLYNQRFNRSTFSSRWISRLYEWKGARKKLCFQQNNLSGPGRLQEPQLFSSDSLKNCTEIIKHEDGTTEKKTYLAVKGRISEGSKEYRIDAATHKVEMPDNINGGTAIRIYISSQAGCSEYYVIDSKGEYVPCGDPDPTLIYNSGYNGSGNGGKYTRWNTGGYDNQKGPIRL